jgi:hypothetical protein
MHFSEDELKEALRRKDPGEGFTQKVMARLAQQQARATVQSSSGTRFVEFWHSMALRLVLAGVIVALLVLGGSLGVMKFERARETRRHAQEALRQAQEARAGEAAKRQAFLALRITNAKLNHVFERAKNPQVRE